MITKRSLFLLLLALPIICLQAQPEWVEISNSIWKTNLGQKQKITLLSAAEINPKQEALNRLAKTNFPLDLHKIRAETIDDKTYLRLPLKRGEEIYGLGLHFQTHNQRGRILNLHVDHYGGRDNGRTHAPVPFYVSSAGLRRY